MRAELDGLLARAAVLAADLGPAGAGLGEALAELRARLSAGRFHLAVLGQFKRGKSTLLNALLGEEVLPAAVIPLTAVPTLLQGGAERRARVVFQDGRPPAERGAASAADLAAFLARFVTEEANPRNRLGVARVEVEHPAPLLRQGVVLIDTPGIGSTHRHNTETTLRFLPRCDAALFVVSADPPPTEAERDFLAQVRARMPRVCFVLNKTDYLREEEREQALAFLKQALAVREGEPVFPLSAREGLAARQAGDEARWRASGVAALEDYLTRFLATEKEAALREAVARRAGDLLEDARLQARLAARSLELPLEELEERRRAFEGCLEEVERQRLVLGDLLAGERRRLAAFVEEQAEDLRRRARAHLLPLLDAHPDDAPAVAAALAEAIPRFFAPAARDLGETFARQVQETLAPHRQRAEDLIRAVRAAAAELFAIPYHPWGGADRLELAHRPYWVTEQWSLPLSAAALEVGERLLPRALRRQRLRRRLAGQVETLVLHNVENLRWATLQNLDLTLRRFQSELARRLEAAAAGVRGALEAARVRRAERAAAVQGEARRLEELEAALAAVQEELRSGQTYTAPGASPGSRKEEG